MSERRVLNVMVDVETTGLKPGAGVWNIGVVVLETEANFRYVINPRSIYKESAKYKTETDTLAWQESKNSFHWNNALLTPMECDDIAKMMWSFYSFIRDLGAQGKLQFWSQGNFDFPHLEHMLRSVDVEIPWTYRQLNDLRTLSNFFGMPLPVELGGHDAYVDAQKQARHLQMLISTYGRERNSHVYVSRIH